MLAAIIADDLTGACDAAVHFASQGMETEVSLTGASLAAQVGAWTTDSRDIDEATLRSRIDALAIHVRPALLFKKIDSVLRGHPGREILMTLDAFGYDRAVITPAYPDMGRIVSGGFVQLPQPLDIARTLRLDGLDLSRCHLPDAASTADLDAIVAHFVNTGDRILWCGSGGLAMALARHVAPAIRRPIPRPAAGRVWFCIGSTHAVTAGQEAGLPATEQIIRIDRNHTTPEEIRALLAGPPPAALFACGGDTATMIFSALGATAIRLHGEIVRAVPFGTLGGGIMDGVPVVTKSGGFGAPDTLVRVAAFFH